MKNEKGLSFDQELRLIEASRQDPRAFEGLYIKHFPAIYTYIRSALGDKQQASDLTADVFYSALRHLSKFVPGELGIRPWLFGIALNQLRMYFRQSGRMMYLPLEDFKIIELQDQLDILQIKERRAILSAQLSLLTEEEQEFIQLRFVAECSFREISQIKGISEEACKMRIYRLLDRLKKTLPHTLKP